ncbi:MAG: tetratricopeptide repeat protein [Chloroflexi bacterium]|nr:tetratricopeptide repeat protein [Chloroflexota bacterium]
MNKKAALTCAVLLLLSIFAFNAACADELKSPEAEKHCKIGLSLMLAGKWPQAETEFKKTLEIDQKYLDARYYLALCLIQQRKIDEAKENLETLLKYGPKYEPAYLGLADIYRYKKDFKKARETLEQLKSNVQNPASADFGLGIVDYYEGKLDEAISMWLKAVDSNSKLASAYFNLGIAYFNKNDFGKAAGYIREAVRIEPDNAENYFHLGWFCYLSGIKDKADSAFLQMKINAPGTKWDLVVQAIKDIDGKNYVRAGSLLEKLLKENTGMSPAKYLEAVIFEQTDKKPDALKIYKDLLEEDPNDRIVRGAIERLEKEGVKPAEIKPEEKTKDDSAGKPGQEPAVENGGNKTTPEAGPASPAPVSPSGGQQPPEDNNSVAPGK